MAFQVHRYTAPKGSFTSGDALWRLVSRPLPDAATTLCLADNGFRAAVGVESDRKAVARWLGGIEDVRSAIDDAMPDASRRVEVDLGPCAPRQVVFHYDRRGLLHGRDFINAKAKFRLVFEMRSVNLHDVCVELVPEIEEPPGPPKWVITEQGAQQVPQWRGEVFTDLAVSAEIPEGGFLVLGPTAAVYDHPVVARAFCVRASASREGASSELRESIYVISPIVRSYTGRNVENDRLQTGPTS